METIKSNTKLGRKYQFAYKYATLTNIYEAYKRPSAEKVRADYFCRAQMAKENGEGYRVIGYNTYNFSVAWRIPKGLRIETSTRSILVTL